MHEDNHDPIGAAERLARFDPRAAAEAIRSIAVDEGLDPEYRINAAEQLPQLHSRPTV
jgi:hypothetical protein